MRTLSLIALVGLMACNNPPPKAPTPGTFASDGTAVVTASLPGEGEAKSVDVEVTQAMLDTLTMNVPPAQLEAMKANDAQYTQFLESLAMGQVLYEKAVAEGLHEKKEVKELLAMGAREVLAGEVVKNHAKAAVNDDAIKARYESQAVKFERPKAKFSMIYVKEQAVAEDLLGKINAGEDFSKLASEHTLDPGSKARGGDMGWQEKGRMLKEIEDAVFAGEVGAVVGPVQTRAGWHLLRVDDKKERTELDEVRDQLAAEIEKEAAQNFIKDIQAKLIVQIEGKAKADEAPGGDTPSDKPVGDGHDH